VIERRINPIEDGEPNKEVTFENDALKKGKD